MRNSELPLVQTTKVGPGDKERAYVVRQNICLKGLLFVLVLVAGLGSVLATTRYEVHVQRRAGIAGAKAHRKEEHASHMHVMRLTMLLQQHLEDEVHDASVLTTYRAWLLRAVGDYQSQVGEGLKDANCTGASGVLLKLGTAFDAKLDALLKQLWDDMVKEGHRAQRQLHNFTKAIVTELRADASEARDYEQLMRDAGEEPGNLGFHDREGHRGGHHGEGHRGADHHGMHHGAHGGGDGDGDEKAYEHHVHEHGEDEEQHYGSDGADDGERGNYHGERDDDDEEHLAGALEALYEKLQRNDSVLAVDGEVLKGWVELQDASNRALNNEDEEADMERIDKKIEAKLAATPAAPAYNGTLWSSQLDFLDELIHRARLSPHRAELLGLLGDWQAGELRISAPLKRVEELIDEDVLMPDVLIVHGSYEMYGHYNGHDD